MPIFIIQNYSLVATWCISKFCVLTIQTFQLNIEGGKACQNPAIVLIMGFFFFGGGEFENYFFKRKLKKRIKGSDMEAQI